MHTFHSLHPKIQIKLIMHVFSTSPTLTWYHNNKESCTHLFYQHIAFTYLHPTHYYHPSNAKGLKRTFAKLKPRQDNNQERNKIDTRKGSYGSIDF
jgi:hypothetical protein